MRRHLRHWLRRILSVYKAVVGVCSRMLNRIKAVLKLFACFRHGSLNSRIYVFRSLPRLRNKLLSIPRRGILH